MSAGQAYGPGIYLASDPNVSLGYCGRSAENYGIMGVVQVLNSAKYSKGGTIYVVPEESDVLLKYLILIKPSVTSQNITSIQKFLTIELPESVKNSILGSIGMIMKRLNKEYMELMKRIEKIKRIDTLVSIDIDRTAAESLNKIWKMTIKFRKEKKDHSIDIKIIFPRTFPSTPCIISTTDSCIINVPMIEIDTSDSLTYLYMDPIIRYDKWRSDIKVYKILEHMILNILDYNSKN
jgi:ubiquitin-protein ligase